MSEGSDDGRRAPPALDQFGMPIKGGAAPQRRRVRRSGSGSGTDGSGGSGRGGAADEPDTREQEATQQKVVFGVFAAMLVGITVLQKIGYGPDGAIIPVILPIALVALAVGVLFARPVFRPERAILYLAVVVTSALSTVLFTRTFSISSIGLYFLLYLPFLVAFDTTQETYRRCLMLFSNLMLGFAVIVWIQHAIQFTIGWQYWPDLDELVPSAYLVPEFLYIQPIQFGMKYMKPSGITFLEVSFISQFITLALIIELLFLHRMMRAVFLGATLFATFAGTGLALLLVALPIVFTRMNIRTFVTVLATAFIALFVALQLQWFDMVANRMGEFQKQGTSGSSRFVEPLDRVRRALLEPSAIFSGVGPGQIERGGNTFWWPIVKAVVEYGLIQGLLLYAFLLFSMFDRTPSRPFAIILILWYSFEGTLLTPLNPIALVMMSSMFILRDTPAPARRARSGAAAAATPATA
ncbi:hypothetical protein [Sphingomonas sp. BK235]|uniref:hypothetical protein n=1 Tax=Sphingomonas sp. BK235 TaxID=2512131 RepID=UPI0010D4F657|nr:hypothetical protein [Sphingomonas sp. BK235]TCP34098.1 hypothetical protein EV292_10488 [Sphingomonas sp. BK235]